MTRPKLSPADRRLDEAGAEPFAVERVLMRMRTTAFLAALFGFALWAAPAQAKLVYVKQAGTASPVVYVAKDSGKQPRRLGVGRAPTISPDGQWVAYVTVPAGGSMVETVVVKRLNAGGSQRLVMRSSAIQSLRFSPDSTKIAAVAAEKRVRVYDVVADRLHVAAEGAIRGYSFSPDSKQIVFGRAVDAELTADSDLYSGPILGGAKPLRITRVKNAVNPVWGPQEIIFDRFTRREGDAPAYNLWALKPAEGPALRRLTNLTIPPLVSGLVPLDMSADGRRALAVFSGQDTEVGFTVSMAAGKTRALSSDFESGTVGFDLAKDGRSILAHTGGPDPSAAHDVVVVPWKRGGKTRVIVEDAAYPDWTR
jgi:Tol biopolymer transport system component